MAQRAVREIDRGAPSSEGTIWLVLAGIAVLLLIVASTTINAGLIASGQPAQWNPMVAIMGVTTGKIAFGWVSWLALALEIILAFVIFAFMVKAKDKRRGTDKVSNRAAKLMAQPRELRGLSGKDAVEKAQRLYAGADPKAPESTGLLIGRTLARPVTDLRMSWEDTAVVIAGQRMGKTQAFVTTSILGAPGACVATANKRDVVDLTIYGREQKGDIWLFDLQNIASDEPINWWWNPLKRVRNIADARKLAGYFAAATKEDGSRGDAYFSTASEALLSNLIFAAAKADGDLLHVLGWIKKSNDLTPVEILRACGEREIAMAVQADIDLNPRQKDGLYAMAANYLAVLSDSRYARAVTPGKRYALGVSDGEIVRSVSEDSQRNVPEFDPVAFVTSSDTVYAMSVEGADSPSALTTALVGQIIDAGQEVARRIVGGRLECPVVCVLDEAANVVRLKELPSLYSYCGSQGIVLMTFLQSKSQARRVWGDDGIRAMMESSNVVIYGGGVKDTQFLKEISDMIGDMRVRSESTSLGQHTSHTVSYERENILGVDALSALPSSQSVIMTSGNRAVLASKVFWSDSPFAALVEESSRRQRDKAANG